MCGLQETQHDSTRGAEHDRRKGCISLVPLPKIDELYAKLQGYKIFSTLDLRSGYYHIGLSEDAKPKTAFIVAGMGKYQFNRVPFGLAQAPAYFQRLINEVLRGLLVAVGRCNTQVRLSLIYVPVSLLDLRYLGSSEEGLTFGHT